MSSPPSLCKGREDADGWNVQRMKNPKMLLYPPRVIAAAAVYITIKEQGFAIVENLVDWCKAMTEKKVEACDLEEILEDLNHEM